MPDLGVLKRDKDASGLATRC